MLGENDNLAVGSGIAYHPSMAALFAPVIVVAAGYALLSAWLWYAGISDSNIARLSIIVLTIGVPILCAHAVLRYFTIRIQLQSGFVLASTGFPRGEPRKIPYQLIRDLVIKRGFAGRLADSGTLVFHLVTGQTIAVCDLARPALIREEIERQIDAGELGSMERGESLDTVAIAVSER